LVIIIHYDSRRAIHSLHEDATNRAVSGEPDVRFGGDIDYGLDLVVAGLHNAGNSHRGDAVRRCPVARRGRIG